MKKLIVANWKMNPSSEKAAFVLAEKTDRGTAATAYAEAVIAPPFPFLEEVGALLKNAELGAQDVFGKAGGAYTGEVSPEMLKSSGVKYVIVGHSERRALGDTDAAVNKKTKAALKAGLKVILCVGESYDIRRKGLAAAKRYVKMQLSKDTKGLPLKDIVVAYEPVWAISTNRNSKPDKPEESLEMIKFVKSLGFGKVLYGGSVTSRNARNFLQYKEVNGVLVGGASLKAEEFIKIFKSAKK